MAVIYILLPIVYFYTHIFEKHFSVPSFNVLYVRFCVPSFNVLYVRFCVHQHLSRCFYLYALLSVSPAPLTMLLLVCFLVTHIFVHNNGIQIELYRKQQFPHNTTTYKTVWCSYIKVIKQCWPHYTVATFLPQCIISHSMSD